mgnify:FL=1
MKPKNRFVRFSKLKMMTKTHLSRRRCENWLSSMAKWLWVYIAVSAESEVIINTIVQINHVCQYTNH